MLASTADLQGLRQSDSVVGFGPKNDCLLPHWPRLSAVQVHLNGIPSRDMMPMFCGTVWGGLDCTGLDASVWSVGEGRGLPLCQV